MIMKITNKNKIMVTQSDVISATPVIDIHSDNAIDLSVLMEEIRENLIFLSLLDSFV